MHAVGGAKERDMTLTEGRLEVDRGAMTHARYRHRWSAIDRRAMGRAQDQHGWQAIDGSIGGRWESHEGWDVRAKAT